MIARSKYDISNLTEATYQPGSRKRVLKNKLSIKSKRQMDLTELIAQRNALIKLTEIYTEDHQFTVKDILKIHKIWLGNIYEWAGTYRQVNVSKDGFQFAASQHIPVLMSELENVELRKFTPCNFKTMDEVAKAIATVHVELILIHPFREGNGRLARLLADIMSLQAGYPVLDYSSIVKGKKRQRYFSAVQSGMDKDYEPMTDLFKNIISKTLKQLEKA